MNPRNLAALSEAILRANLDLDTRMHPAECMELARLLASNGVLVPSALDEVELGMIGRFCEQSYGLEGREILEDIAKGGPLFPNFSDRPG